MRPSKAIYNIYRYVHYIILYYIILYYIYIYTAVTGRVLPVVRLLRLNLDVSQ